MRGNGRDGPRGNRSIDKEELDTRKCQARERPRPHYQGFGAFLITSAIIVVWALIWGAGAGKFESPLKAAQPTTTITATTKPERKAGWLLICSASHMSAPGPRPL